MRQEEIAALLSRQLLELETPKAQARKRATQVSGKTKGGKAKRVGEEMVSAPTDNGKALEHVAAAVGTSAPSLRKGLAALEKYEADPGRA